jgi:RNA polymerase-binding transcription factor DksA
MKTTAKKSDLKGGCLQRLPRPEPSWLKAPAASSPVLVKWKWHQRRLTQLLAELREDQRQHLRDAADSTPAFRRDAAETATDEFDRDMLLGKAASEQDLIYEVEQALTRIAQHTYGLCELTGKPVSKARLRAVPWTRFSQQAERSLELNGTVHTTRLGELRSARPSADTQPRAAALPPEKDGRKANSG